VKAMCFYPCCAERYSSQHVRQQPHHDAYAQLSALHRHCRGKNTLPSPHTHTIQGCGDSANTRHCDCKNLRRVNCRPPDGLGVAIHGCCKPCTNRKACTPHHLHTDTYTLCTNSPLPVWHVPAMPCTCCRHGYMPLECHANLSNTAAHNTVVCARLMQPPMKIHTTSATTLPPPQVNQHNLWLGGAVSNQ